MCAKSFGNRFPLFKLNRKSDFKRFVKSADLQPRRAGRGERGISRRKSKG